MSWSCCFNSNSILDWWLNWTITKSRSFVKLASFIWTEIHTKCRRWTSEVLNVISKRSAFVLVLILHKMFIRPLLPNATPLGQDLKCTELVKYYTPLSLSRDAILLITVFAIIFYHILAWKPNSEKKII